MRVDRGGGIWDQFHQAVMKTIDVMTQTGTFADLVDLARQEAGLVLVKSGQPVAQLIPMPDPTRQRIAPLHPDAMQVAADFDAALPDEFWLGKP